LLEPAPATLLSSNQPDGKHRACVLAKSIPNRLAAVPTPSSTPLPGSAKARDVQPAWQKRVLVRWFLCQHPENRLQGGGGGKQRMGMKGW
jgi:hypothetical protein